MQRVSRVNTVLIEGRPVVPTRRFWTSLQCRFGFSGNIFRYFDHAEVFNRISERAPDDVVRYCIEKGPEGGHDTLLAVTNPNGACVRYDQLRELLTRYGAEGMTYANGIVRSAHTPKAGATPFSVLGDDFVNQFVIDTPIDGFGRPSVYLSLMRLLCTNGMIGYNKAFRSELSTGSKDTDTTFALVRAMDGFNNEEGFSAFRQRLDAAGRSWASVNEVQKLYKLLTVLANSGLLAKTGREYVQTEGVQGVEVIETASPIFHAFHQMTGDVSQIYGLANIDSLSIKRQRTLPTACRIFDLINFATEIATHQATPEANRRIQAFFGELIANEYDLEGTVDQFGNWQDFFVTDAAAIDTREMLERRAEAERKRYV
jgi:hypothetical protein